MATGTASHAELAATTDEQQVQKAVMNSHESDVQERQGLYSTQMAVARTVADDVTTPALITESPTTDHGLPTPIYDAGLHTHESPMSEFIMGRPSSSPCFSPLLTPIQEHAISLCWPSHPLHATSLVKLQKALRHHECVMRSGVVACWRSRTRMYRLLYLMVHIVYRRYLDSHLPAMLLARWYDSVPWGGRRRLREIVAAPSGDTWHLTDHDSPHMEYLVLRTWEVTAFADWVWQTRLNTLLVKAISLVVEARALSVDVTSLFVGCMTQGLLEGVPGQTPSQGNRDGVYASTQSSFRKAWLASPARSTVPRMEAGAPSSDVFPREGL